jgi:short-subunit dehydrogenase
MKRNAILIGNSDGIGLAMTRRLLAKNWNVIGISRSRSSITDENYLHYIADVSDAEYLMLLNEIVLRNPVDLCIYLAGIGELINLHDMKEEVRVIDVNLIGMIKSVSAIIPKMVERDNGHFIGISSLADELHSAEAPSYHASKAGFSSYLESLALTLSKKNVYITNARFGFVDTKMAKGDVKPFMMTVEKAVNHLELCIIKKPARYTAPKIVIPLIKLRKLLMKSAKH